MNEVNSKKSDAMYAMGKSAKCIWDIACQNRVQLSLLKTKDDTFGKTSHDLLAFGNTDKNIRHLAIKFFQ